MTQLSLDGGYPTREAFDRFSTCKLYRYLLAYPTGVNNERIALLVGANPSKANRNKPDPTAKRWIGFCKSWGFGWAWMVNTRAWVTTDPKRLPADPIAIGPENDMQVLLACRAAELVVCGWGKLASGDRAREILETIRLANRTPHALGSNNDGSPTHPLYLRATCKPVPMGAP